MRRNGICRCTQTQASTQVNVAQPLCMFHVARYLIRRRPRCLSLRSTWAPPFKFFARERSWAALERMATELREFISNSSGEITWFRWLVKSATTEKMHLWNLWTFKEFLFLLFILASHHHYYCQKQLNCSSTQYKTNTFWNSWLY